MKMLCLTVLPVLGVWSYSVYMLSDTITIRSENEMVSTDLSCKFIIKLNKQVKKKIRFVCDILPLLESIYQAIFLKFYAGVKQT